MMKRIINYHSQRITNRKIYKVEKVERIMNKQKNLEEIFWKDGKFVNGKGNQVNPKPIGLPLSLIFWYDDEEVEESKRRLQEHIMIKKETAIKERPDLGYQEANSYSACLHGRDYNPYTSSIDASIQFYKI